MFLIIISSLIKSGSVSILYITNIFAQWALQKNIMVAMFFAFQTNTFCFLVNIEYTEVLIHLCWEKLFI